MIRIVPIVLVAFALMTPGPAVAHKVIASVFASGDVIEGEIGFSNGTMAKDVLVEVLDEAGVRIGETRTDAEGFFTFRPKQRIVHVFRADLGAGHVAEARFTWDDQLPADGGAPASPSVSANAGALPAALDDATRDLLAEAIRREIKPLRREIAAYKERNDLQSILGGVGYIVGLFGVGFYFAARRRLTGS